MAIDRLRARDRRAQLESTAEKGDAVDAQLPGNPAHERTLDAELDRSRMQRCILDVVDRLPTTQRAAILLGQLRGLSDRELADALGVSLGAAKIRLHRARRALKAALERACSFERDEQNELACAPRAGGPGSPGRPPRPRGGPAPTSR